MQELVFGNETTFMYFLSTLAQSTAAIAGLLFVAAQFHIQWLDQKLTATKSYIIRSLNNPNYDYYMDSWESSDTIKAARNKKPENSNLIQKADKLEKLLVRIEKARKDCKSACICLLLSLAFFILEIPFIYFMQSSSNCIKISIFILNALILVLCLYFVSTFVINSMYVQRKNKT